MVQLVIFVVIVLRLDLNKKKKTGKTGDHGRKDVKRMAPLKFFSIFLENS